MTGRHRRDLDADAARLHDELGVTGLLLLVEDHELEAAHVENIAEVMRAHGVDLLRYPIVDVDVPTETTRLRRVIEEAIGRIVRGDRIAVACRGGLGRTGTVAALILRDCGVGAEEAIRMVRDARHGTIETAAQEDFVRYWEPR